MVKSNTEDIKKFLSEFNELKDWRIDENIDFGSKNIEFYLVYEKVREHGVYQLNDNESTIKSQIKSEWSDDYVRDGMDDEETIKNDFNEFSEVYEDEFLTIWVDKIVSKDFEKILNDKLNEFKKSDSYGSYNYFDDFMNWLSDDNRDYTLEDLWNFEDLFNEGDVLLKTIVDEVDVDYTHNIIKWGSWSLTSEENLKLMYRELKD